MTNTPRNYLNNRDLLAEIHKSKTSYCSFTDPKFHQYDIIVHSISEINSKAINQAKQNQAKRLSILEYNHRKSQGEKVKLSDCEVSIKKISKYDLVFRVMTYDHIPLNPSRKKKAKTIADHHEKVNFKPFQHWKFNQDDELVCVGKSHWSGDLITGHFDNKCGKITNNLALMMFKLCERYATKGNVRMYTYNDEMISQAILQLTAVGLQFDESKSDNPFSYLTSCVTNSFVRVLNIEKMHQEIRDDLLEAHGLTPSSTRQYSEDYDVSERRTVDDHD